MLVFSVLLPPNNIYNMKKTLLFFFMLLGAVITVKAQSDDNAMPRFSAGFNVGPSVGHQSGGFPAGFGVAAKLENPIASSPVSLTGSLGYEGFVSKDGYYTGYSSYNGNYSAGALASFIPVMIGARVYAGKIFFEGDAGASFNINGTHSYYTDKPVALVLSPSIGYGFRFGSSQRFGLDLSVSYQTRLESNKDYNYIDNPSYITSYGSYSLVAINVAFSLGL